MSLATKHSTLVFRYGNTLRTSSSLFSAATKAAILPVINLATRRCFSSLNTSNTTKRLSSQFHSLSSISSPPQRLSFIHSIENSPLFLSLLRHYRSSSSSSLVDLQRAADSNPDDATKQYAYYKGLMNSKFPEKVVERVENGRFAYNTKIALLYSTALEVVRRDDGYFRRYDRSNNLLTDADINRIREDPRNNDSDERDRNRSDARGSSGAAPLTRSDLSEIFRDAMDRSRAPASAASSESGVGGLLRFLFRSLLGAIIFIFVLVAIQNLMSQSSGGNSITRELGISRDVKAIAQLSHTKFSDVKGCDEAKADLEEVVAFLKNPQKFNRLGGQMPKGVLLLGPPGTGKTLLAKAVAGEANVPFFAASGSDFEEMFVGVGARRIRDLFAAAKKRAPAIIFIDEIDAVGGKRSNRELSSTRMSLNQLLVEMDGFSEASGVVVIAATNFPQMLDPALTRPGRFDKHVNVPLPDINGRTEILQLYGKKIQLSSEVDLRVVARGTPGASGADLFNLINSAAVRASALGRINVTMDDMEYARDKILMGSERKGQVMTEDEKKNTAYHESGHALIAIHTQGADPVHKATILPRGMSLGLTHLLPEHDVHSRTRKQLMAQLDVYMGGRLAEEMINGHSGVTTGASNDLEMATKIARRMVLEFAMGEGGALPYRTVKDEDDKSALSTDTKAAMDKEINRILGESYERAKQLLEIHRPELDRLANALLKYETLDREQIMAAIRGEIIPVRSTFLHTNSASNNSSSGSKPTPPVGSSPITPALAPKPATNPNANANTLPR